MYRHIVIHQTIILYQYTLRLYRYIEYVDVSKSKLGTYTCIIDAVVVYYVSGFTALHLFSGKSSKNPVNCIMQYIAVS